MPATIWRGRLAFGMVAIPVRLYKAARRERIRFRNIYRPQSAAPDPEPQEPDEQPEGQIDTPPESASAHRPAAIPIARRQPEPPPESAAEPEPVARVHQAPVGDAGQEPVPKNEILKGYELERDRYVVLEPSEVAALRPRTSTEIAIAQFARLGEIDPIYFETSYFMAPGEGGEKPFALLYRALLETEYAAIGTLAMHGREHRVAIRTSGRGLILHTLFNANETAREQEYPASPEFVALKELELAKMLVEALAAPFDPAAFEDSYEQRLRALLESRAPAPVASTAAPERKGSPVIDIMEALRKSLQAARKPVQSETAAPAAKPKTAQRRRRGSR